MTENNIRDQFYIEDHAVLYGLLCQSAEKACGERGLAAAKKATILYARERGLRMAMRAQANGDELTSRNYLVYGEWVDHQKWSASEIVSVAPEYRFNVVRCGWCDSWRKYGLVKYGEIYCSYVDENLAYGFNPEIRLEIDQFLAHGHEVCNFHWVDVGFKDEADRQANDRRQVELAGQTVKDFLYHTGHILSALQRTFYVELGLLPGQAIVAEALAAYADIFGQDKKASVVAESQLDYLNIVQL